MVATALALATLPDVAMTGVEPGGENGDATGIVWPYCEEFGGIPLECAIDRAALISRFERNER